MTKNQKMLSVEGTGPDELAELISQIMEVHDVVSVDFLEPYYLEDENEEYHMWFTAYVWVKNIK